MTRYTQLLEKKGEPRLFGHRPYLSKNAQERMNRESRDIYLEEPDYVDDPEKPTVDEVLAHIKRRESLSDADLIVDLLAEGLDWEETIVYYLYRFSGLDKRDIYYATEGIRSAPDIKDRGLIRHIDRVLASVEQKMGVDLDIDVDGEAIADGGGE